MSKAFRDRFAGRVHRTRSDGTSVATLDSNLHNRRTRPGAATALAAKERRASAAGAPDVSANPSYARRAAGGGYARGSGGGAAVDRTGRRGGYADDAPEPRRERRPPADDDGDDDHAVGGGVSYAVRGDDPAPERRRPRPADDDARDDGYARDRGGDARDRGGYAAYANPGYARSPARAAALSPAASSYTGGFDSPQANVSPKDRYLSRRAPRSRGNGANYLATPDSLDEHFKDLGECASPPPPPPAPAEERHAAPGRPPRPEPRPEPLDVPRERPARRRPRHAPRRAAPEPPLLGDELNEKHIKQPEDQLYFSRKARAVSNFQPYTLDEYKKQKPGKYVEFGKLQPDLMDPVLVEKRRKAAELKEFSRQLQEANTAAARAKPQKKKKPEAPKEPTRVQRAADYARNIPKPKVRAPAPDPMDTAAPPTVVPYDDDEAPEFGDELYQPTRLESLEAKHDQHRAMAADIRKLYGF